MLLDRLDDVRVAIAHLVHAVSVKIHDAPPLDVGQPDALAGGDRIQARGRQRLMQKMRAVGIEKLARLAVHVLGFPGASQR